MRAAQFLQSVTDAPVAFCYPAAMATKPRIGVVGAGNFAAALAASLVRAGYGIAWVIGRNSRSSAMRAQGLAKQIGASAQNFSRVTPVELVWFCVPDSQIVAAAKSLAERMSWEDVVALHSSGALASDALAVLRDKGAAVASVHPLMTFVRGSRPSLANVPFAIEGDAKAVRVARAIVNDVNGIAYPIHKADKAAYHAWGTFASPLFTALLATAEQVAGVAGVKPQAARKRMIPILLQTLANYASFGAPAAFSGPIVRGDVETVKKHLKVLKNRPTERDVYKAIARAALLYLPTKKSGKLKRILK